MKCSQTSRVEDDRFLHWSQMNTFPVLHAVIVNVRLIQVQDGLILSESLYKYLLACRLIS